MQTLTPPQAEVRPHHNSRRFNPVKPQAEVRPNNITSIAAPIAPTLQPTPEPKSEVRTGLKKVTFGKAAVKKPDTKTAYPVFDDPQVGGQVSEIAARIKQRAGQIESLEGAQKTDKLELRMFVGPFYYKVNAGKHEAPSSISIPSEQGEVLVTWQNRYAKMDENTESQLNDLLGADRVERYFRQAFTLKIPGEALPEAHAQEIVDAITAVLDKYNCSGALEVDAQIKPTANFHAQRLLELTPDENLSLDEVCPVVTMVKTKGRGDDK